MFHANANVVRAVVDAQLRRDWKAFRRLYDRGLEWEEPQDYGATGACDAVSRRFGTGG